MMRCMGSVRFFIPGRGSIAPHSVLVTILKLDWGYGIVVDSGDDVNAKEVVESVLNEVPRLDVVSEFVVVNGLVVVCNVDSWVSIEVSGNSEDGDVDVDVTVNCVFGFVVKLSSLETLLKKTIDAAITTLVDSMAIMTNAQ